MASVLRMSAVTKRFGSTLALDAFDLDVTEGEIHGFLGPNGAGKSTALRMALGLLRADGGYIELLGGDPWRDAPELHLRLAYVPGEVSLWPQLTGGEIIDLLGRLRGGIDTTRRDALIEEFELDPTRRSRGYSKGNRQKVALIAALASDVELLLLDEPTSGLDPLMESIFQRAMRTERERGRTVLLSSHMLSEVEALCDSVTIIRAGQRVEHGNLATLRHLSSTRITATVSRIPDDLGSWSGLTDVMAEGSTLTFAVGADHLAKTMERLASAGVTALVSHPPSLEDLFLRQYGQ
ncbi:MAG: ABC transporter ATP-binding protein [Actinomycetes bacterium]